MMSVERLRSEGAITLNEAAAVVGGVLGKRPAKTTLIRWHEKGSHGVRLAAQRVGSHFYTTRQAVEEFIAAYRPGNVAMRGLGAVASDGRQLSVACGEKQGLQQRCREIEQAHVRLRRLGLRFLLVC